MRQAYPNQYGYGPYNSQGTEPNPDGMRLANLKRAIESMEQRMSSGAIPSPLAQHSIPGLNSQNFGAADNQQANELAIMQQHIARLSNQIESSQFAMSGSGLAVADVTQRQQLLSQQAAHTPVQPGPGAPDVRAASPIQSQQAAHTPVQPGPGAPDARAASAIQRSSNSSEEFRNMKLLARQLAELRSEMSVVKQHVTKPVTIQPKVQQSDIERIAAAISELQSQSQSQSEFDGQKFDRLNTELKGLRSSLTNDLRQTTENNRDTVTEAVNGAISNAVSGSLNDAVAGAVESVMMQKQSEINARLDALAQGFDNVMLQSSNERIPQIENLTAQLYGMRVSLDDLPQTLAITKIDERLLELSGKIESLSADTSFSISESPALNDDHIASIENRLDEIARALVAVSNMGNRSPEIDLTSIERLEARMTDLGRTVDGIAELSAAAAQPTEFDDLAVRIDGLNQRLASFEKYAEAGDLGGASAMFATPDIGQIEQQLQALSEQVVQAPSLIDLSPLELHLQQLSDRFEEVAAENSNAAQLSNLEAQIAQMVRAMSTQSGVQVDIGPMEARLGQIEEHVLSSQSATIETAQQAAQQAVAMLGPQNETTQFLTALSQDLQALQVATESVSDHNVQTSTVIHDTLQQIVDRLGFIEDNLSLLPEHLADSSAQFEEVAPTTNELPSFSLSPEEPDTGIVHKASVESGFTNATINVDIPRMAVESPPLDPVRDIESSMQAGQNEDHQPLEPGSKAPNLDQMVAEASAQLKSSLDTKSSVPTERPVAVESVGLQAKIQPVSDDVRPDAVAAARRALQATTAEINEARLESGEKAHGQTRDGLNFLSTLDLSVLRKPVVMAAAAVLLVAAIAWKGYQVLYSNTQVPVAQIESSASPEVSTVAVDSDLAEEPEDGTNLVISDQHAVRTIDNSESMTKSKLVQTSERSVSTPPATAQQVQTELQTSNELTDTGSLLNTLSASTLSANIASKASIQKSSEPAVSVAKFEVSEDVGPAALVAAAQQGDALALYEVGMRYSKGRDVNRDMTESAKWFERSASEGFAPAQYSIGSLYEKGIGVKRDVIQAADWYEKAASQGNARAMYNLAVIRAMGNPPEVQPNIENAIGWFEQAANYGVKDSQFNLGILYGQGMGVPQSLATSYKWFAIAAKTGDSDAAAKRDEVANAMDASELSLVQEKVKNWNSKQLDVKANRVTVKDEWQGKATGSSQPNEAAAIRVKQAQNLLNQRGFGVGEPDGLIGPKTTKAIMEFQRSAGLAITGKVDEKLLKALELQT